MGLELVHKQKLNIMAYLKAYDCYAHGARRKHLVTEDIAISFVKNSYDPEAEAWLRVVPENMIQPQFIPLFTLAKEGKKDFSGDDCASSPDEKPAFHK